MKPLFLATFLFTFFIKIQAQSAVANSKMNVFYIGVENPVTIALSNVPASNEIEVKISEGTVTPIKEKPNAYIVKVNKMGIVTIDVFFQGTKYGEHKFRVKKIPDPTARLPIRMPCFVHTDMMVAFKEIKKMVAVLDNFNFDVKCEIVNFKFTRSPKIEAPITLINISGDFSPEVNAEIAKSKKGDTHYFDDVLAKCPGDIAPRTLNSLVYTIRD